jgi:hypothetical protein
MAEKNASTTSTSRGSAVENEAASSDAPESPERIEAEIEQTREELGETAAALAEKSDVRQQAQQKFEDTKEAAQAKISATAEAAKEKFQTAPEAASQITDRTVATLREDPAPALAAVAALLVIAVILRRRSR